MPRKYNTSPAIAKGKSAVAVAVRENRPEAEVNELRRELKYATTEKFLMRVVAEAPPLTDAQRADLAALLAPAGGAAT